MVSSSGGSYRDGLQTVFSEVRRGYSDQQAARTFFAIVAEFNDDDPTRPVATVTRYDSTLPEGPYRVAAHVGTLSTGDRVKVEDVTGEGGFVIAYALAI